MRKLRAAVPVLLCLSITPSFVVGCAGEDKGATSAPPSEDEVVRAIRLEELAKSSPLRVKIEEQNSEWRDENIMNGAVDVMARKVTPATLANLENVAKAALIDRIRDEGVKLHGVITTSKPSGDLVPETSKVVAIDGFFFSDKRESVAGVETVVRRLVAALGPAGDIDVAVAKAKVDADFGEEEPLRATAFVFANKKTAELVIFYARQATG